MAWTFGTYETVWSLYLTSRGATPFVVGLSFATYALPIVLFAGLTAGLADRLGHVRAGAVALVTFGLFAATYPFVANVAVLILIGLAEGSLTAAGIPALNAEISRLAPPGAQGRTQGMYQLVFNSVEVAGAVAAGALYGLGPGYPFFAATGMCLLGVTGSLLIRRARAA
jgi:DHA1 family tetracycline resistance protein-like MFS transporter